MNKKNSKLNLDLDEKEDSNEPAKDNQKKYLEELEKYDPNLVGELMYAKKERKIPSSISKPHNPHC